MASISYPRPGYHDGHITSVEQERLLAVAAPDGVYGHPSDPAVVYADGTGGRVVKIRAGSRARVRASLWESGDTDIAVSVAENTSGLPRVDRVVLRLDRSAGFQLTEHVITGVPAQNPSPPALTRKYGEAEAYDLPMARVRVEPGAAAITADKVTRECWYLGEDGQILCTPSTLPPAAPNRQVWDTTAARLLISDGTRWIIASEDTGWAPVTAAPGWAADGTGLYVRRLNGSVHLSMVLRRTGAKLTAGTDSLLCQLPAGFAPDGDQYGLAYTDGANLARIRVGASVTLVNYSVDILTGRYLTLEAFSAPAALRYLS